MEAKLSRNEFAYEYFPMPEYMIGQHVMMVERFVNHPMSGKSSFGKEMLQWPIL